MQVILIAFKGPLWPKPAPSTTGSAPRQTGALFTVHRILGFYYRRGRLNGGVHWGDKTAVYTANFGPTQVFKQEFLKHKLTTRLTLTYER